MKLKTITRIFENLNKNDVRYLIAGGLAVVAHGYVRLTIEDIERLKTLRKEG